jgi:polyisoprenoid-binding protein YceI
VSSMTNYLARLLSIVSLGAGACWAGGTPAAPATPAAVAATATRYVQAAAGGSLSFTFVQADAATTGSFRKFSTELTYDEKNPAAGTLKVTVQIGSLETQDKDRDDTLKSADLFDAQKYPTAQYLATSFAKRAGGGLEAIGKLTLRGVTRDLRLPLMLRTTPDGVEISGDAALKRLDFGVGQGEWKSTEWVGDEVKLHYKVPLTRAH